MTNSRNEMAIDKDVIDKSYGFTIDADGEVHGLVDGDMGYEPTGIKIGGDTLEIWKLGCAAWDEKHKTNASGG